MCKSTCRWVTSCCCCCCPPPPGVCFRVCPVVSSEHQQPLPQQQQLLPRHWVFLLLLLLLLLILCLAPQVSAAVCAQLCRVNTNSRYLSRELNTYCQELTDTLPAPLKVQDGERGGGVHGKREH